MEYSNNLKDYLKERELDKHEIVNLGIDLCEALILCHKKNIVHRDIKEENIFISKTDNHYKLGDFSVSKELKSSTSAKTKVGTMNYMPPEIIRGESYNKNVDIYSLGIVLYKLLNKNRLPFLPDYPKKLNVSDIEKAYLERISGATMNVPLNSDNKLSKIILKACAFDKNKRYQHAIELKDELSLYKNQLNNEKTISDFDKTDTLKKQHFEENNTLNDSTIDIFSNNENLSNKNLSNKKFYSSRIFKIISISIITLIILIVSVFLIINIPNDNSNKTSYINKKFKNLNIITPTALEETPKFTTANSIKNSVTQTPIEENLDSTIDSKTTTKPKDVDKSLNDSQPPLGGAITIESNKDLKSFKAQVDNVSDVGSSGIDKVVFRVTPTIDGVKDAIFFDGINKGNGIWQIDLKSSEINLNTNLFHIRPTIYDKAGNEKYVGLSTSNMNIKYSSKIRTITPITSNSTFDLEVSDIKGFNYSDIKAIQFKSRLTTDNPDDVKKYTISDIINNKWKATINIKSRNAFHYTTIYIIDNDGNEYFIGSSYVKVL